MKLICLLLFLSNYCHSTTHNVIVQDNNFSSANITIQAGDTVRWGNFGNMDHNVASRDPDFDFRCANGCDDNGGNGNADGQGWFSEVTFHKPDNSIPYVCEPHENNMTGSIKVLAPLDTTTVTINPSGGFLPQQLEIYKGTRVLFINQAGDHNIKADDESFQCADGCRDDGMNNNQTFNGFPWQVYMVFNNLGSITYHCENPAHTETGTINVVEEPPIFANGFETP